MTDRRLRQITWGEIDSHRDSVKLLLGTDDTSAIHQRLRDERGLTVSVATFRR